MHTCVCMSACMRAYICSCYEKIMIFKAKLNILLFTTFSLLVISLFIFFTKEGNTSHQCVHIFHTYIALCSHHKVEHFRVKFLYSLRKLFTGASKVRIVFFTYKSCNKICTNT